MKNYEQLLTDESFWPDSTVQVGPFTLDLCDLWTDESADAMSVMVARAIVAEPPSMDATLTGDSDDDVEIEVFVWSVGGDCITLMAPLSAMIQSGYRVYEELRSQEQADDLESHIRKLEKLSVTVAGCRDQLTQQLATWQAAK